MVVNKSDWISPSRACHNCDVIELCVIDRDKINITQKERMRREFDVWRSSFSSPFMGLICWVRYKIIYILSWRTVCVLYRVFLVFIFLIVISVTLCRCAFSHIVIYVSLGPRMQRAPPLVLGYVMFPDSKVHGASIGLHVGAMNLAIWVTSLVWGSLTQFSWFR